MPGQEASSPSGTAAPRVSGELRRLWAGVLLPPTAWVAQLLSRYLLIRFANVHGLRWPLLVPTVPCLILLLLGAWLCWRARGTQPGPAVLPGKADFRESVRTLALWGLATSAFFLLLMLAQAYPDFVLSVREVA